MRAFWILVFLTAYLAADEEVQLIRQADAYFHAREFDRAYELYASLLEENLAPWQKARLRYNLGTILMQKGDAEKARLQFAEVQHSIENTPYLSRALQTNLAILNFRLARSVLSGNKGGLDAYSQAFFYLRAALDHTNRADLAECQLQTVKGRSDCESQDDLKTLRMAIKNQLAIVLDHYGDAKVSEATPKEGVPFLITGTNLAESHLDFLDSLPSDNSLRDSYQELFTKDMQAWGLLWKTQVEKLPDLKSAHTAFDEGTKLMGNGNYSSSRIAFLDAEAKLTELMQKLWGDDPLTELLRKILVAYQYALDQFPVQASTLYQLDTQQRQVNELVEEGVSNTDFLNFSNQQLRAALEYARRGEGDRSRFYLHEARQWIRRLLREDDQDPEGILEASIQDQVHSLRLNHLTAQMKESGDNFISLLNGAQQYTLQTATPFIPAVLEKEKREWPERCQCKPWNRVIPLYIEGERAAVIAEELLENDPEDPFAMRKQEEAVKYWKEALHALRHPEEETEEEEEKEDEKQEEPPPQEEEEKQPIGEVMRQLQQMHREDKRPVSGSQQTQKGIRPW